jgi:hypothetical protein
MSQIEFLPSQNDPVPAGSVAPTDPADTAAPRRSRRALLLRPALALLLLAAVVAWLATRPSGRPGVAAPQPTVVRTVSAAPPPPPPNVLSACYPVPGTPRALLRLVRGYLPQAVPITGALTFCPTARLWTRRETGSERLTVLSGRLAYTVAVYRHGSPEPWSVTGSQWADSMVAAVRVESAGVDVQVEVTGPQEQRVDTSRLRALAEQVALGGMP